MSDTLGSIQPTTTMPVSTGFLGMQNFQSVQNNLKFAAWLEALKMELKEQGVSIAVDFIPGAQTNKYFTPSDYAWLLTPDANIFCQQGMMGILNDLDGAASWVKTQIDNQKRGGKIERT